MEENVIQISGGIKHISCECKRRFDERKCNSDQCCINDKCWCEC